MTTTGKITSEIIHLDIKQYGILRSCSIFLLVTPESIVVMDIGTSNDVHSFLDFMKGNNLALKKVKYIVPSHHHFDHLGGGWKLWKTIREFNPEM